MTLPIIQAAAAYYGCSIEDLTSVRRHAVLNGARYASMHVLRHRDGLSLPQIGKLFGGRDHSTVINALRRAAKLLENDPGFAAFVAAQMERPKYDKSPVILPPLTVSKIKTARARQGHLPPVSMIAAEPPKPLRIVEHIKLACGKAMSIDENGDTMEDITHKRRMASGSRKLFRALELARAA